MTINLRPYQSKGLDAVRYELKTGAKSIVLVAPTGAGKTVVASAIIDGAVNRGRGVLFLAHRLELVSQAAMKLATYGVKHRLMSPESDVRMMKIAQWKQLGTHYIDPKSRVVIGTIQTVSRRLDKLSSPDIIIIDECHLSIANTYQKICDEFPNSVIIGLTATPKRTDGRGLGEMYERIVKLANPQDIADLGFLVPMRFFAARQMPNLSGIKTVRGDYDQRELANEMDKPTLIGDAVEHYKRIAHGRPAMVFCVSVKHAEDVAAQFRQVGYKAVAVSGETESDTRNKAISGLADGSVEIVCNCALYIEGLDQPVISCIILLAPTKSLSRYLQSVGRGSRPANGKTDCIVLDHAGNCQRHGFPYDEREWSLDGKVQTVRAANDNEELVTIRTCTECYHVHEPSPICPACGFLYPISQRKLAIEDGELVELTKAAQEQVRQQTELAKQEAIRQKKAEQGQAETLDDLIALGKQRGYKFPQQWAERIFKFRSQKKRA